ncbi:MAG: hypothetical protein ACU0FH_13680 [Heliomarina sp.]|uniref:hypothetical protein n=1 Tax=Heliomarina sp. TaxID=2917556 RepID=UPI004058E170
MDNRTRALWEAVSLDGWIGKFDDSGVASVHVDVVFRNGSFGEDPTVPIRFKIALKRAEVVVKIGPDQPLKVIKKSIQREKSFADPVQIEETVATKSTAQAQAISELSADLLKSKIGASGEFSQEKEFQIRQNKSVQRLIQQHFTTPDSHPAWEIKITPASDEYLYGAPWEAEAEPRFSVKRTSDLVPNQEEVTICIEVRCRREDIEILDLEQKDTEKQSRFRRKKNSDVNLAAAEQLIKAELEKAGFLDIPDLGEKHARLLIADKLILEDSDD